MKTLLLATLLLSASCATPYQPSGFSGGFTETRVAKDMYEVSFNGNGYTGSTTVNNYLLRRCAELTQINGYTHFIILGKNKSVDTDYTSSYNSYTNQVNTYSTDKHGASATIKMLNNPPESSPAYEASIIYPLKRSTASE